MDAFPSDFWVTAGTAAPVILLGLVANSLVFRLKFGAAEHGLNLLVVSIAGGLEALAFLAALLSLSDEISQWRPQYEMILVLVPLAAFPLQSLVLAWTRRSTRLGESPDGALDDLAGLMIAWARKHDVERASRTVSHVDEIARRNAIGLGEGTPSG